MATSNKNYKQLLLVSGYIRNIEQLHNLNDTPSVIYDIIYLYQRLCDEWSSFDSHKDMEIDELGCIITANSDSQITAYGANIISKGIYEWRLQIISLSPDSYGSVYVGIIENDEIYLRCFQTKITWDSYGYQISQNGLRGRQSAIKAKYYNCGWNKVGDIIEITLDLYANTLSFTINNHDKGVAFTKIENREYRLALSISYGKGSTVKLL